MSIAVLATLAAVATLPGLAVGASLRLRGWLLVATAPLLTYGVVGAAASAVPAIGLRWSPGLLAGVTALLCAVALLTRVVLRRWRAAGPIGADLPPWGPVHHGGVVVAASIATVVGLAVSYRATGGFAAVPQIWDAVWHSNATHYIAETGESHPSALRGLNNAATSTFYYPNAYHVLAATTVMLLGAPIVTVIDISVGLLVPVLAVGLVALVRHSGGRPALAAAAALLSCAFTAFPYDVLPWGALLPFNTAVALLPGFLALLTAALSERGTSAVALALGSLALLALHPSVVVAAVLFGVALLTATWLQRRPRMGDLRALGAGAAIALVLGGPLLVATLGAVGYPPFDWPADLRPADAFGQLLFLSHGQAYPQYWLVALAVVGLTRRCALRPLLWFVAVGVVFAGLFVAAASYEGDLVTLLTRAWWNDRWRFAALWSLPAMVLAAAGLVATRDGLWLVGSRAFPALGRLTGRRRLIASAAALSLVVLMVAVLTDGLYRGRNETRLAQAFTDGPTVSAEERRAYEVLSTLVPEGSLVMNDAYDGSSLMWALADVRPVFASPVIQHQELPTMDPNRKILYYSFNQLDTDARVRQAVESLNIRYVVVGTGFIGPATAPIPGMQGVGRLRSLKLVYQNRDARIYEIDVPSELVTARTR